MSIVKIHNSGLVREGEKVMRKGRKRLKSRKHLLK